MCSNSKRNTRSSPSPGLDGHMPWKKPGQDFKKGRTQPVLSFWRPKGEIYLSPQCQWPAGFHGRVGKTQRPLIVLFLPHSHPLAWPAGYLPLSLKGLPSEHQEGRVGPGSRIRPGSRAVNRLGASRELPPTASGIKAPAASCKTSSINVLFRISCACGSYFLHFFHSWCPGGP